MRLLKPPWVSLDEKPIFSIDIHPDGSRFAIGGQGDNSGKVSIWNMAPVRSEDFEKNPKCPRLLCQMDNHLACVNSVRWSNNGRFLASGADDKMVMIWQTSKYGGVSTVFGSEGKIVNIENWRCVHTLRGHEGDVLDVAWAPQDNWLASCSIDNTIIVWNMERLPGTVAVLKGHSSLVKGVTWDPVGKYLASQSDDKSLRVWRTVDWQQEAIITEPFKECGGTTHVLRLGWSPDGHYIVSAHAMNNSGPTAQIIKRDGWKTSIDFVGHRKAITVVRFNNNIFTRKKQKSEPYTCCAIGSRDRSLSIWLTSLKRPLIVMHDLFHDSILDISWSPDGLSLLCCSWDGTVAYVGFDKEEIGHPMTTQQKLDMMSDIYGKSIIHGKTTNQIIESADLLTLQEKEKAESHSSLSISHVTNGNSNSSSRSKLSVHGTPVKMNGPQIETKTRDGRRRITPILLAVQPDVGGVPVPFSFSGQEPTFSSSTEKSTIPIEKKNENEKVNETKPDDGSTGMKENASRKQTETTTQSTVVTPTTAATTPTKPVQEEKPATPTKPVESKTTEKRKRSPSPSSEKKLVKKSNEVSSFETPPKKKDGRGRPRKDRTLADQQPLTPTTAPIYQPMASQKVVETKKVYAKSSLELPIPEVQSGINIQISGSVGDSSSEILEVCNNAINSGASRLHLFKCIKGSEVVWENMLTSPVIAVCGNSNVSCAACKDCTINMFSTSGGLRLFAGLVLDSPVFNLRCSGQYCMAITSYATLYVWNIQTLTAVISNISVATVIQDSNITIHNSLLTEQGLPVITLNTGASYTYKTAMGCWVLLTARNDGLQNCSDYKKCLNSLPPKWNGPLATLQGTKHRQGGSGSTPMLGNGALLQRSTTISHLEQQLSCCVALQSKQEYHFWLTTYVRYLAKEAQEKKLRLLFDDLLGPIYKSKNTKWESMLMGFSKRDLLKELLPLTATNLTLQRVYTEYNEQLQSMDSS